jgi:hypothetical protein
VAINNIYFVITKEPNDSNKGICNMEPPEIGHDVDIVITTSPGKARAIFTKHYKLEYTEPLRIRKLRQATTSHEECLVSQMPYKDQQFYWDLTEKLEMS